MCNNRHQTSSNPLPAKRLISFGPGPVLALLLVNLMIPSGPVGTVAAAHPTPHYSVAPVYPAPRNQGLRPTRWRPWNRSTIYPVYPGMQPPPSSSMLRRRQQPGTLPPLPFEEEPWDEEWDEEEGQFSRDRPLGLDGDLAPKPPADLDPGLPLPDGRPRSDDLPPFLPDAEPETDLSEDLFPLPGEDQETIPKRDTEPG
ncbi:MAG: hypothetical protein GTO26_00605, partial [Planctomycetales bacterium]|nr:hypothetical protein [Planctomycetales bacterium]